MMCRRYCFFNPGTHFSEIRAEAEKLFDVLKPNQENNNHF